MKNDSKNQTAAALVPLHAALFDHQPYPTAIGHHNYRLREHLTVSPVDQHAAKGNAYMFKNEVRDYEATVKALIRSTI